MTLVFAKIIEEHITELKEYMMSIGFTDIVDRISTRNTRQIICSKENVIIHFVGVEGRGYLLMHRYQSQNRFKDKVLPLDNKIVTNVKRLLNH